MNCKNCKKQGCSLAGKNHEMSFECKAYVGKTNADRLRQMSDEELAEFLADFQMATFDLVFSELCKQFQIDKSKMPIVADCVKDKLKTEKLSWLKAPAEEGDE